MIRKLPWVLLAISIIFNFTFTGGFLRARSDRQAVETPESGTKMVADEFGLTEDQQKVFSGLRQEARARTNEVRQGLLLTRQDLLSEMSSDSPDPQRLSEIQDRLAELYWEYRRQSSEHLQQFLKVLRPDQRRAVMKHIRDRERTRSAGRRLLERFDRNGDGKLDKDERASARQHFPPRHGRGKGSFPRGRPPWYKAPGGARTHPAQPGRTNSKFYDWIRKRFDADGDGKLSDDERARAREALDTRRGPRRPPASLIQRFDTDGDGKLSPAERARAMKAPRKRPPPDTNRDER